MEIYYVQHRSLFDLKTVTALVSGLENIFKISSDISLQKESKGGIVKFEKPNVERIAPYWLCEGHIFCINIPMNFWD